MVQRQSEPGPTTNPPLTLTLPLRVTTAIWFLPVLGLTHFMVGKMVVDPLGAVRVALPVLTLVPSFIQLLIGVNF